MKKIKMENPIVEMEGDGMPRLMWNSIKETLLLPFIELNTVYFDLGLSERKRTGNKVVQKSIEAMQTHRVGIKCSTAEAGGLPREAPGRYDILPMPGNKISTALNGTVFHKPIPVNGFKPLVSMWQSPVTVAEYAARGYSFNAVGIRLPGLVSGSNFVRAGKKEFDQSVYGSLPLRISEELENDTEKLGVSYAELSYVHTCIKYALGTNQDLWIIVREDAVTPSAPGFGGIFKSIYESEYKADFESAGIRCIFIAESDLVTRALSSGGGFVLADADSGSNTLVDLAGAAFGSPAMMRNVLVAPNGIFEYEVAGGPVTTDNCSSKIGGHEAANPSAVIFAWAGALRKRGELDEQPELVEFADRLDAAVIDTVESGIFTCDLACRSGDKKARTVTAGEFLTAVHQRLKAEIAAVCMAL